MSLRFPLIPLGVVGRVSAFLGALLSITLAPARLLAWVALVDAGLLLLSQHPPHPGRLLHPRRLLLLALLALPPLFLLAPPDRQWGPLSYSTSGLAFAVQITLRFLIILLAVEGFTRSVEIVELAALLERAGMKGLGFSLGVALNLLPALQRSSFNAWQVLRMRGGWRRQRWRAANLLLTTIITGTLRRAEETALAAEARAFSPERLYPWPLTISVLDKGMALLMLAWVGILLLLRLNSQAFRASIQLAFIFM